MTPITKFKEAIETANWALAREAYTDLTGQEISSPDENQYAFSELIYDIRNVLIKYERDELDEADESPTLKPKGKASPKPTAKKATTATKKTSASPKKTTVTETKQSLVKGNGVEVKTHQPMKFPFAKDFNEKEAKANKKLFPTRSEDSGRPPAKQTELECDKCGDPFIFEKAYPGGVFDKKSSKLNCESCQLTHAH